MISRLVLNLRSISSSSDRDHADDPERPHYRDYTASFSHGGQHATYNSKRETSLWTRALGNLGGDVSFGTSSGNGIGTRSVNVEVVTTTEVVCDIPMERLGERPTTAGTEKVEV